MTVPSPSTLDFRVLFEAAPVSLLVLSPRFDVVAASDAFVRDSRTQREQLIGRNLFDLFPSNPADPTHDISEALGASLRRVLDTRLPDAMEIQRYDLPRPPAEGGGREERYWRPHNAPVLDAAGEVAYLVHRVEDVTEWVVRLKRQEELVRLTGGQVTRARPVELPSGTVPLARPHRPPTAPDTSPPKARVLVADDNEDMRDYMRRVLSPEFEVDTAEDGQTALEASLARPPELIITDVMMPRLDGVGLLRALRAASQTRHLPILLLSARRGEQSMLEALEAGADDYLVKPFSSQELLARVRSSLELVHMRREVTRERAHADHLAEAIQARDDFLSVASHELRTPLATFQLHLDLAERGLRDASQFQALERLVRARRFVRRLASLVDLMLDVSQITSGQLTLVRTRVDLAQLLGEVTPLAEEEARRAGTPLLVHVEGPAPGVFDAPRLSQVFHNLLSNALKFGAGRPVEVRLRREACDVHLEFMDHGLGIQPEDKARIFERFERAVSARNYGGLGLGLWVAREVVEAHAGRIVVSDTPGGGTTFHITLPLLER